MMNFAFFHQQLAGICRLTGSYGVNPQAIPITAWSPWIFLRDCLWLQAVFTNRMLQVYQLTANTTLTMPEDKLTSFANLLLDGQAWLTTASGDWPLAVIGRSISAPGRHRTGFSSAAIRALPVRQEEMAAFADTLENTAKGGTSTGPVGNRMYYNSDCMVHRRAKYSAVVRMHSKKTVAARCINGACLKAQHVADGTIQLYPTDSAAARLLNMPAVWDWHSIPGVTVDQASKFFPCDPKKSEAIGYNWPLLMPGASFVGGVSDGTYGASAMAFSHSMATSLRKRGFSLVRSQFMLDDAVVILGAGYRAAPSAVVATTMANERLSGEVLISMASSASKNSAVPPGNRTFCAENGDTCPSWLWHNGTGIVPLAAGSKLEVNVTNRTGDWASLTAHAQSTASTRVVYETFSARIIHGNDVDDKFGYVVLPAVGSAEMPQLTARWHGGESPVLHNTEALQAVSDTATAQVQAVFWPVTSDDGSPTSLKVPEAVFGVAGVSLSVSMPAAVLLRRLVSCPRQFELT